MKERMQTLAAYYPDFLQFHEGLLGGMNARGEMKTSNDYEGWYYNHPSPWMKITSNVRGGEYNDFNGDDGNYADRPDVMLVGGTDPVRGGELAFKEFMHPSVWFIFGSIVIGMVFTKTGLTKRLAYKMLVLVGEKTTAMFVDCLGPRSIGLKGVAKAKGEGTDTRSRRMVFLECEFLMATFWGELVVPTVWSANVRLSPAAETIVANDGVLATMPSPQAVMSKAAHSIYRWPLTDSEFMGCSPWM